MSAWDPALKGFRIMHSDIREIPWAMILPHERQAWTNHYQTLERLDERGGLSPCEALAVLEDRRWQRMDDALADAQLERYVRAWEKR